MNFDYSPRFVRLSSANVYIFFFGFKEVNGWFASQIRDDQSASIMFCFFFLSSPDDGLSVIPANIPFTNISHRSIRCRVEDRVPVVEMIKVFFFISTILFYNNNYYYPRFTNLCVVFAYCPDSPGELCVGSMLFSFGFEYTRRLLFFSSHKKLCNKIEFYRINMNNRNLRQN